MKVEELLYATFGGALISVLLHRYIDIIAVKLSSEIMSVPGVVSIGDNA